MIKLTNVAKVLGNYSLLYTQINNADRNRLSVEQIANIFSLSKALVERILINNMPEIVTEEHGLELQESHVMVEFITVATFVITTDEELIFYNMLLESAPFRKAFFEKLKPTYPLNEDDFLDNLEITVATTEQTKILDDMYKIDFSIKS